MFRQLQANRGLVVVRILSSQNAAATRHTHGERRRPRRTRIRDYFVRITHVKRCWPHAALKKGSAIINQAIKVKYGQTSKKTSKSNDGWLFIICRPGCSIHRRNVLIYAPRGGMWPWWWWGGGGGGGGGPRGWQSVCVFSGRRKSSSVAHPSKIRKRVKGGNWLHGTCNRDGEALWPEGPWQPHRAGPRFRAVGSGLPPRLE